MTSKKNHISGSCLLVCVVLLLAMAGQAEARPWWGKVVYVVDGDSIIVMRGRKPFEVRLWAIDAPEYNQPGGKKAKAHTEQLVGQTVRVHAKDVDRYGRLVAEVYTKGRVNWGLEMVRAGLARWYKKYAPGAVEYMRAGR